jgi:hypothetical protein
MEQQAHKLPAGRSFIYNESLWNIWKKSIFGIWGYGGFFPIKKI